MATSRRWADSVSRLKLTMRNICLPLAALLLASCSSLPEGYVRTESSALDTPETTTLGARTAKLSAEHPGESGFALLRNGNRAFNMRLAMIDLAEKTLDLQVYIWSMDETGAIMADRVLDAANRGVRVRLLIDDFGFGGTDQGAAVLDSHPNIEIRLFNPFASRDFKMLDFLSDTTRVNQRMHNKLIVADNSLALVGGRNIGDNYFDVNPGTNFRDLDIAAIGPVVRQISDVFDHFWRNESSVPVAVLVDEPPSPEELEERMAAFRSALESGNYPYDADQDSASWQYFLDRADHLWKWGRGGIVWDRPHVEDGPEEQGGYVIQQLRKKLETVESSFTVESAYFIVGDRGVATVKELIGRGVEVRVLTNSLASNDVLAAHAGHANYREDLLEAGVEMYEFRADSKIAKRAWVGESRAGLHTKAMVFDGNAIFVGSLNLDPRSANINTEAGLYVESEELADLLLAYMDDGVQPTNAYRVTLDEDGDLLWTTEQDGEVIRYDTDPLSTWGQRFMSGFIGILPVDSQL